MNPGQPTMEDPTMSAPKEAAAPTPATKDLATAPAAAVPPPTPAGQRIAAIDVGSNSIRLVVAEVLATGGYRVLDEERANTRLAAALVSTGRLDPKAAYTTVTVLR